MNEVKQNSIEINPSKINDEYALDVGNLTFRYFGSQDSIIENLDLKIYKNKHTVITGANGSGKSTLIGLLSGALQPESGNVVSFSDKIGYIGQSH